MAANMRSCFVIFVLFCCVSTVLSSPSAPVSSIARSAKRIHLPFLGLGPRCNGCPSHFCDDDPAIVHGYCCGCARFFDNLPVICSPTVLRSCPLNSYELCEDYEYMMYCCCD